MKRWTQVYLVPGAVFVAVVMGGGYGTGREVVEFFTRYGLTGGLYGIVLATAAFGLVLAATFEFARALQAYDYRSFFQHLLGRLWWLYEVLYLILFLLVLGVLSAAARELLEDQLGVPPSLGLALLLGLIAALVMGGRSVVSSVLTYWSAAMYVVFILYFVNIWYSAPVSPVTLIGQGDVASDWWQGGLLYPLYNLAVAPVLLFVVIPMKRRKEAVGAGLIAALMVMLPALLFHLSYAAGYPSVLEQNVPNYWMIEHYAGPWLLVMFLIALFGTLVETGAGLVFGFLERIDRAREPQQPPGRAMRLSIVVAILAGGAVLSSLGLVGLIAQGYSALAMGFALVYVWPLLTLGLLKLSRSEVHSNRT